MKKILIVTIFDNVNIGTYLQAYSLYYEIKKNECYPIILNYCRPTETFSYKLLKIIYDKNKCLYKKVRSVIYLIALYIIRKRILFFLKKNTLLNISRLFTDLDDINNNYPIADIYITGSDQVWNSEYNNGVDIVYYLGFVNRASPKVAYAASIGLRDFPDMEKKDIVALLKKYKYITVRESDSCDLLARLGITGVCHVLDPTFLLSKYDWITFSSNCRFEKTEPYLLVYSVEGNIEDSLFEKAYEIAKNRSIKIYVVSPSLNLLKNKCDRSFNFALPDLFVKLILEADFVLVSSFHGTAFSINLEKDFLSFMPNKYCNRVLSLLRLFGLEDRMIDSSTDVSILPAIDYEIVRSKLSIYRLESKKILKKMID